MKLRINGNSIRLRLSKSEVNSFVEEGRISSMCQMANSALVYSMVHGNYEKISARFEENYLTVLVPSGVVKNWNEDERVGFDNIEEGDLYILIEKDFQCLKPRMHEDESDLFINPQAIP